MYHPINARSSIGKNRFSISYLLPKGSIPIFRTQKKASIQIPVIHCPRLSPPTLKRPCTRVCLRTALNKVWEGVPGGHVHPQTSCLARTHCPDLLRDSSQCTWFGGRVGAGRVHGQNWSALGTESQSSGLRGTLSTPPHSAQKPALLLS